MNTPDQLEERLENLTFEILFHKYLYFEYDKPHIQDSLYDSLKVEFKRISEQLGFPINWTSPGLTFPHGHPLAHKVARSAKNYLGYDNY